MKLLNTEFTYFTGDMKYVDRTQDNAAFTLEYDITDDHVKAFLIAKKNLTMHRVDLDFSYEFKEGDKFFGNGYQSWTTSREYTAEDKMKPLIGIAKGRLKYLAGISADTRFVDFPTETGAFVSHCYTYIKNGADVHLIGSLTERQGFTVIYADMKKNTLTLSKDVEGVTLEEGERYELFDVVMFRGAYDEVFDAYFKAMGVKKPVVEHMSGYTSWYNYFQKINEKIILRDLNALDIVKDSVSIFQIDDGYETFVGDWTEKNPAKFPRGMRFIADQIHEKGYLAGIWIAPFSVQIKSETYKKHPDWVVKYANGKPILGVVAWGGAYTLDLYNDDARAYIRSFFDTVLHDWGYDMVKLDFLYSQCMYPRNNKSRGTIMCEAMDFLRECCGDKLILGCGVPLGAAFGRVDACRISCDVDLVYGGKFYNKLGVNNEVPSAQNAITNSIFRRHLDGRVFCNDPDVFFFRYSNLTFNTEQKVLLAAINHIFGNVLFVSDNAEEYKGVDVDALRKVFAKSEFKVLDANYVSADDIVIDLLKEGKQTQLRFNIKTGKSNVEDIIGIPVCR
ncbi:MAG: alpha-galactosidase [Clostridia bacterium]|nr:alpha-galactosidase [Clostridia bacterium]